jgi:hypothetical protein
MAGGSVAITEDSSTPAVVQVANGTGQPQVTTASFSPPAGSLLVAVVSLSYGGTASLSVSDSGSHAWSEPVSASPGASYGAVAVFTTRLTSAPGAITVTAKGGSSVTEGTIQLALRVVDGAAAVQAGATQTGDAKSVSVTAAITTTTPGSWVYIAGTVNDLESSVTPNGSTTTIANYQDTAGGDTLLAGRQSGATGTPGPTTLGWTVGTSYYWALAMLEVLPAPPAALASRPAKGAAAVRKGTSRGTPGAPVPVAQFTAPQSPAKGRAASARKGSARGLPGAPRVPVPPAVAPLTPARKPSRGTPAAKRGSWKASAVTAVPASATVVNTWTAYRTATGSVGGTLPAPMTMPLDCPVGNSDGNWLIAICSWAMPAAYPGATMAVADDVHGFWVPCGIPSGDSPASGLTRCSIWAKPNSAVTGNVYVAPCGLPSPVYPQVIGVTVIEVAGLSDYAGIPAVVTASQNAATSVSAATGAPVGEALMVTVCAGDFTPLAGPGGTWTALTGVFADTGGAILHTSPAWQVTSGAQTAAWTTTEASDLSVCTAVILLTNPAPAQPSPDWPYTQLQAGFGSGALTPPSQITWTDITPRFLAGQEASAQRGKQRQLDQIQAGTISLTVENSDSAFDPGNVSSPYYPYVVVDTPIRLLMTWQGRTYSQFSGYVEKWPQSWKSGTRQGLATITVTDAWSLLIDGLSAVQQQEIQALAPYAYWTCGDAAGSAYAANSAAGNSNVLTVVTSKNGALTAVQAFGADSGVNPGDPSATVWSQSGLAAGDNGYGYALMCADPNYPQVTGGITLAGWFSPTGGTTQENGSLLLMRATNSAIGLMFQIHLASQSGAGPGEIYFECGDKVTRATTPTMVITGNWCTAGLFHVAVTVNQTAWTVYVNGVSAMSGTCNLPPVISWLSFMGSADRYSTAGMLNGECCHLAVFGQELPADRIAAIFLAGCPTPLITPGTSATVSTTVAGAQFAGEYPAQRIERLAAYGGWAGTRAISQSSTTAMGAITDIQGSGGYVSASGVVVPGNGQQAGEAITNIVGSDDGFMSVDGTGALCYVSRGDLYGQGPAWYIGELTGNPLNENWSLVTGVSPWTAGNSATIAPSTAWEYLGYPALLLTGNGSTANPYAASETTIPVTALVSYTASVILDSPQGWSDCQMSITWYSSTGASLSTVTSPAASVAASTATLVTLPATAPAGAATARFRVQMTGTPASSVLLYVALPMLQETVSAGTAGEYPAQPGITYSEDKALLYNVAELTQSTGSGTAIVASDPGSALQHGQSPYTATAYQELAAQVADEANWIVGTQGTPVNRPESLTVNAGTDAANWPLVLALEPAMPVQAARRPVTASATTVVQAVAAQVTRKFDAKAGTASVSVTGDIFPEGQVLTADNPVLGQLSGSHPLPWLGTGVAGADPPVPGGPGAGNMGARPGPHVPAPRRRGERHHVPVEQARVPRLVHRRAVRHRLQQLRARRAGHRGLRQLGRAFPPRRRACLVLLPGPRLVPGRGDLPVVLHVIVGGHVHRRHRHRGFRRRRGDGDRRDRPGRIHPRPRAPRS